VLYIIHIICFQDAEYQLKDKRAFIIGKHDTEVICVCVCVCVCTCICVHACACVCGCYKSGKGKVVLLHAMEVLWVTGSIAPTFS
jgi:hypothetical protein